MTVAPHSISIALATYNGAVFLEQQLESLTRQTTLPAELIVCDDRSTDETVAILERFAEKAPFEVRIQVNVERLGWRGNFVKAAGLCSHELIAFCDQDDLWYADKLATVALEFADPSVMLVFHNADLVDQAGLAYGTLLPIESRCIVPSRSRPTTWSNPLGLTMTFRSALARFNDLWPESVDLAVPSQRAAHDQWFYFLATNVGDVVSLPQRLLGYRQHANNAVGWENDAAHSRVRSDRRAIAARNASAVGMLVPFTNLLARAAARGGPLAPAFASAHAKNDILAKRLQERGRLYAAETFIERLGLAARATWSGAYLQRDRWGLGRRALLEDWTTGLFGK